MGTRGIMGIRLDGVDKLMYNHWDSYPSGLGEDLVAELATMSHDVLRQKARDLKMVTEETTPTPEEQQALAIYADLDVSSGSFDEWYVLLHDLQGKLGMTLDAGYGLDAGDFITDSLFCEWAYIINLDENTFEVYKGFQTAPHTEGRYASKLPNKEKYYPCALVATFNLAKIDEWKDTWSTQVDPAEDEEEE